MSNYSIELEKSKSKALVTVLFGREENLDNVVFAIDSKMMSITQSNLSTAASATLTLLAIFIGFEPDSEEVSLIVHADDEYLMHISTSGLYVRFTRDEKEIFYWDSGEFTDTPSEVLGAVCGALITNCHQYDEMVNNHKSSPVKTAEAKQVLQLMDSYDDGDNRCVEFIKQVSEKSGKSYDQISKELEPFI